MSEKKSTWRTYLNYGIFGVVVVFVLLNFNSYPVNFFFIQLEMPLSVWLLLMLGIGYFFGRTAKFRRRRRLL